VDFNLVNGSMRQTLVDILPEKNILVELVSKILFVEPV
jgi:hypothetical protein